MAGTNMKKFFIHFLIYAVIFIIVCLVYMVIDPTSLIQETFMIHIPRIIIYTIWTVMILMYLYLFLKTAPERDRSTRAPKVETPVKKYSEIDQLRQENQELKAQLREANKNKQS